MQFYPVIFQGKGRRRGLCPSRYLISELSSRLPAAACLLQKNLAEQFSRRLPDNPFHLQIKKRSQNLPRVQAARSTMPSIGCGSSEFAQFVQLFPLGLSEAATNRFASPVSGCTAWVRAALTGVGSCSITSSAEAHGLRHTAAPAGHFPSGFHRQPRRNARRQLSKPSTTAMNPAPSRGPPRKGACATITAFSTSI